MKKGRKYFASLMFAAMISSSAINVFAADNDGWTEATQTRPGQTRAWTTWCKQWETIKNSPTQMSLSPGEDETELNFAWYSKDTDSKAKLKISTNKKMKNAKTLKVTTTDATEGFKSNKATATNLKANTKYYYSYTIDGEWTEPTLYETQKTKSYSFGFVGDPQIGSSQENIPTGSTEEQGQDNAVRNDSFNWNNTINTMLKKDSDISFIVSAGDQIQTRDKKNPSMSYNKNEIEYAGYLSPTALKSVPVATTIGNHDAVSGNYSYHFNTANSSELGSTMAGGDYYYTYGNTLFIMLNTNNYNIAEHQEFVENAVKENKNAKWKVVTLHQDIYGSGEHSNEPEIANLRYNLIPIFEDNDIDVVLTGHDHTYSRSYILKGGSLDESSMITDDEFEEYLEGEKESDETYQNYLESIEDADAVETTNTKSVTNPEGILYMTANSASGSKYYDLVEKKQAYIASRWQEDVPTYSIIDVTDTTFTINTYRTDNNQKIDSTFTIKKTNKNNNGHQNHNQHNNKKTNHKTH